MRGLSIAIVVWPFAAGALSRVQNIGRGDMSGDRALIALSVHAISSHPVLLGTYSRFFWHHPGPLYFYLLSVPNALFGGRAIGLVLGVTAINLAATLGVVIVAMRRGGTVLGLWTALLVALYVAALGPAAFDLWNPSATLLPFALVLALSWSVMCLDVWAIPWLAFAGTFCVQTHVGTAPGVLAAWTAGAVVVFARLRRGELGAASDRRASLRRAIWIAAVVLMVLWAPPLVQQLTSSDGNLQRLVSFFASSGTQHSWIDGLTHTGFEVTLFPRRLFHGAYVSTAGPSGNGMELVVSAVVLAAGAFLAVRTRVSPAVALFGLVAVELVVAVYGETRIVGELHQYLLAWVSIIGLMAWVAVGAAAIGAAREPMRGERQAFWRPVALALVLTFASAAAWQGWTDARTTSSMYSNSQLASVVSSIIARAPHARALTLELGDVSSWPIVAGTAYELERGGLAVHVVRSKVTSLIFDSSYVAPRPAYGSRLVFYDSRRTTPKVTGTVFARAGHWTVVRALGTRTS